MTLMINKIAFPFMHPTPIFKETYFHGIKQIVFLITQNTINVTIINQRTNGPVNAHLISGVQKFRTQNRSGQPSDEVPPPPPQLKRKKKQRTNGPVNAHLISWPSKAQNIQNLENIW